MKLGKAIFLTALGLALLPMACKSDGLIGGDCADGFAYCDGVCISITDDEMNCGGCDIACRRRLACIDALCGGPDGDVTVDDLVGGNGGEGGSGDGDGTGGINVGAGGPGGRDGTGASDASGGRSSGTGSSQGGGGAPCLAPLDSPKTCGSCDVSCPADAPNCTPTDDGGYECTPNCTTEPFITECSGKCVDVETDPRHCGTCGVACASGICLDSECIGAASGHQIAICASYERNTAGQNTLLSNAVFIGASDPVRILGFVRDTERASEVGTDYALNQAARIAGREYNITKVTALNSVNNQLTRSDFDVFLVYDQQEAPAGRLGELGSSWADPILDFSRTGGVVVLLTGGGGTGEMGDFIENAGIFNVDGISNHDGERLYVKSPGDAVGINVISPFLATSTSCLFDTKDESTGDLVHVVTGPEPQEEPAVVHRIVLP